MVLVVIPKGPSLDHVGRLGCFRLAAALASRLSAFTLSLFSFLLVCFRAICRDFLSVRVK